MLPRMLPPNLMHMAKLYTPPAVRWGVAGGSVVFFLAFDDLPSILLETPYGQPCGYRDLFAAMGLMKPKAD